MDNSNALSGMIISLYWPVGDEMLKEKEKQLLERIDTIGSYLLVAGVVLALVYMR